VYDGVTTKGIAAELERLHKVHTRINAAALAADTLDSELDR
jgi:hypothetical protein